ncbi:hypothetical protein F2Q69_00012085 [Brassica cretica]|uniref:Uncharacterized protein n=1 Tax=Brassica cretica TaxID=69181 RepID=A0A8S9R6R1_BRACR|nr:hypothetical protein F2Q69_00012085 [Brassica cretica]
MLGPSLYLRLLFWSGLRLIVPKVEADESYVPRNDGHPPLPGVGTWGDTAAVCVNGDYEASSMKK